MAEKIISPGVFTNEIDQSFLPSAVADIGAALIGPTLKGPAGIPTVVTSFSEFQAKFGDVFKSGSNSYQFLTSHAAEQYLKNSNVLTVVRIMAGSFGPASAEIKAGTTVGVNPATASLDVDTFADNEEFRITQGSTTVRFIAQTSANTDASNDLIRFFAKGANSGAMATALATEIDAVVANGTLTGFDAVPITDTALDVGARVELTASAAGTGLNGVIFQSSSNSTPTVFKQIETDFGTSKGFVSMSGGTATSTETTAFTLETLADGTIMNNADSTVTTNSVLTSGSKHNVRYEVTSKNNSKGTFTLTLRAGNDNIKRKQTLETFNNLSLDPNSTNYVAKVIGDQKQNVGTDGTTKYLSLTGSYANSSRFVRVKSVSTPLIDYLDENGNVRVAANSSSLPNLGSGSSNGGFSGGTDGHSGFNALGHQGGDIGAAVNFYENITETNSQGFNPTAADDGLDAYTEALDLLSNQDEFDINLILAPGIISNQHATVASKIIDVCESRGDAFAVLDPVLFDSTLTQTTTEAEARDSNFAAVYWPWIKVPDSQVAGTQRWVPPSVAIGGIYAFNDKVAHPWFAPAGLNRGGIDIAIQAERKLTQGNRDDLYDSNVNPIATFPGQGVTVFGQKTLQKKASALDRINVRRLLIRVKKFIASSSRFLLFEQNNSALRSRFLNIVNPFLENVQSQSGLTAFRVVMDETNNTPDVIDRNQLVGQLFLQPTRTAEFIVLDFIVQPTGAAFPE